jgi:hypothetical protein
MERKHIYPSLQKLAIAKISQKKCLIKTGVFFFWPAKGCDIENLANSSKTLAKLIEFTLIFPKNYLKFCFLEK